jgi:hypothetical protein
MHHDVQVDSTCCAAASEVAQLALHHQSVPAVRALLTHLDALHSGLCPCCQCGVSGASYAASIWRSLAVCLLALCERAASLLQSLPPARPIETATLSLPDQQLLSAWSEVCTFFPHCDLFVLQLLACRDKRYSNAADENLLAESSGASRGFAVHATSASGVTNFSSRV